jgi:hypothetical protein
MKKRFLIIITFFVACIGCAQTFKIETGKLFSNSACYLNVNNATNWVNNNASSNITLTNSTVKFSGTGTQYIGGTQPTPFYNLRIAKTSGDVYLAQHSSVNNQIYMESGDLDLRNFNITLSSTALLQNETFDKRIKATDGANEGYGTGYITTTRTDPTGNVANLGLNFLPVGGDLGSTEIRRGHLRQQGSGTFTSNYSIFRYYQLLPATMRQITVTNFYYFVDGAPEVGTNTETQLEMFQEVQYWNGSSNPIYWEPRNGTPNTTAHSVDNTSTTANPIMLNYIKITLASTNNPLPVEFLSFYGNCNHGINSIYWQTASESNNYGFIVEKSNDAENWTNLQFMSGQGTVNHVTSYSTDDIQPFNSISYYRLHQIDNNGVSSYSNIISVQCNSTIYSEDILPLQPDGNNFSVVVQGIPGNSYHLIFTNVLGQQLIEKQVTLSSPQETFELFHAKFASGIYYISMIGNDKRISKPVWFQP